MSSTSPGATRPFRIHTREDRAVSNVIAVVLLIALTVVIAGTTAMTVTELVNGQLDVAQQMEAQLVTAMEAACADAGLTCSFD